MGKKWEKRGLLTLFNRVSTTHSSPMRRAGTVSNLTHWGASPRRLGTRRVFKLVSKRQSIWDLLWDMHALQSMFVCWRNYCMASNKPRELSLTNSGVLFFVPIVPKVQMIALSPSTEFVPYCVSISGNDTICIKELKNHLINTFQMKDPVPLTYFLGLSWSNTGIHVSQGNYAKDLLSSAPLPDAKQLLLLLN